MSTRQPTKEEEEDADQIVQIGPTDLCGDEKEEHVDQDPTILPTAQAFQKEVVENVNQIGPTDCADEKLEHKDQDPIVLPTPQAYKKGNVEKRKEKKKKGKEIVDEQQQRKWRMASMKRSVESVRRTYDGFIDDEDRNNLQEIDEVDEDNVDDATFADLSRKIELAKSKIKKQFDDDKMKEKVIQKLHTNLDYEAKGRHHEAERMAAEAKKVAKLVSDFKANISRLEEQQRQVPTENIRQKVERGLRLLQVLEPMAVNIPVGRLNYDEFVTSVDKWNEELMAKTFWDHSPSNKEKTKPGRKPVLDYDNVKVERFIFNPERTRLLHFIEGLRDRAADHPQYGSIESKEGQFDTIQKRSLLQFQTTAGKQPPRWFIVQLEHDEAEAGLHMRSDNLYIGGFSNQQKQIYELGNGKNPQLLKGSVPFGCDCDYPSLMDYGEEVDESLDKSVVRLKQLVLNMWAFADDIVAMSEYDHTKKNNFSAEDWKRKVERVQMGVGRSAIVLPELCRFLVLLGLVDEGWKTEGGSFLTDLLIEYMRHWKVMSERLRNDTPFTAGERDKIEMTYAFEAFNVLCLVLNAKGAGIEKNTKSNGNGPKPPPPPPGPVKEGETSDDHDSNDAHPTPEPRNAGGSDSQGAAGGNDRELPQDGGGTVSSILSLQGVAAGLATCSSIIGPTDPKDISTDFSGMKGIMDDLLLHYRKVDAVNEGLSAMASSAMNSKLSGQPLVEILSVHTNSPFVKTISIYDDRSGKYVYNSKDADPVSFFFKKRDTWLSRHPEMESNDYMEKLVITGPDRAMSACPGFVLEADVDDENGVFDVSWSWDDRTFVDQPMTQTIFTSRGEVHVTSAVMSNAVQASIEFMLFFPFRGRARIIRKKVQHVFGRLQLQIDNFSTASLMFESGRSSMPALVWTAEECEEGVFAKVPLSRNVFALPANSGFHVTGDLFMDERFMVHIDHYIELKYLLSGLCKWPVGCEDIVRGVPLLLVSHAAVRVKTVSPF